VTPSCPECGTPNTHVIRTDRLRNDTTRRRHACRSCAHRWTTLDGPLPPRATPAPRSSHHSWIGLTESDIVHILRSPLSDTALAPLYNCSRQSISNIRNGRSYAAIRPDIPRRSPRPRYSADGPTCTSCSYWNGTRCFFDYPEAAEDPRFAQDCDLYTTD
jgi:hypothetical protein